MKLKDVVCISYSASGSDQIRLFLVGFTCCSVDVVSEVEVMVVVKASTEILPFV
jgi:hypothetical protein